MAGLQREERHTGVGKRGERERELDGDACSPLVYSPDDHSSLSWLGPKQEAGASSSSSSRQAHRPKTGVICFSRHFSGELDQRGSNWELDQKGVVTGIQTSTHMECWHHRQVALLTKPQHWPLKIGFLK